ncbi:hypothetical protein [Lysobacter sp. TAB13]|uniref:hypothetical protein n=1 Tax=Lysobacter sp. TAB13 TaxID=3233065 RepID=UPI003F94B59B
MPAMLQEADIEFAVDLQARSYALLKWTADAIQRGFIGFDAAHAYARDPQSAATWIQRHYADLPREGRPPLEHLDTFCRLFVSQLDDTQRLVREPGQRLYSQDGHCFCEMCSGYINNPSLRARTLNPGDLRRADRTMRHCLDELALDCDRLLEQHQVDTLMRDAAFRETLALYAYIEILLQRLRGGGAPTGVPLALWRRFAWTAQGAPKRKYRLNTEAVLVAQHLLRQRLAESG